MTKYDPNPIDFLDTVQLDISVSPDVATKLDAMSTEEQARMVDEALEPILELAERSLMAGGADFNECDMSRLARSTLDLDSELFHAKRTMECDYIVMVQMRDDFNELRATLSGLLDAFPRLASDYATHEQQCAYRAAMKAVGR